MNSVLRNGPSTLEPNEVVAFDVRYCNVEGGWPGEGNFDADPGFAIAADGRLAAGSPCIDAGTNDPGFELPAVDLDGVMRVLDGDGGGGATVDVGPFEFVPDAPSMALAPTTLAFSQMVGDALPDTQTFEIASAGGAALAWSLEDIPDWLNPTPTSGVAEGAPTVVTLGVDPSGLALGRYAARLRVAAPNAVNAPRYLDVLLDVNRRHLVPDEYATIQAALDAAIDRDEVIVADGVYTGPGNTDLRFGGKQLTLASENGAEACVIDGEEIAPAIVLDASEPRGTTVRGFTFARGGPQWAVLCAEGARPTIQNCVFEHAVYAGLRFESNSVTILQDCLFRENDSAAAGDRASLVIRGGLFTNNQVCIETEDYSYIGASNATFSDNVRSDSFYRNGVVTALRSNTKMCLADCRIVRNSGPDCIVHVGPHLEMVGCVLQDNVCTVNEDLIGSYVWGGRVDLTDCVLANNEIPGRVVDHGYCYPGLFTNKLPPA